jgi:hypothetical protein
MWQVLRNRYGWMALTGGLLLALIVSLMMVAPLRTAATQFLNNLGFEPDDLKVYPTPVNSQDFYGRVYTKTRIKAVRQIAVTSLEQASQLAGFRVLMPTYVPDGMQPVSITHVFVTSAHAYRVGVNLISARALLQLAGLPTDAIPADKERAQVTAEIPSSVVINQTQGSRWFTLILARNPVVTVLKELDPAQLRELDELGLRYLGLAQTEAHQLSQQMDWAAFLVAPPADMNVAEPVSISGHGGYRLHGAGGYGHQAVIWEAEGVLCSIYGGLSATELMAMAESLK